MSDFRHEEDEFFSVITQRVVIISYRRFGTTYRVRSSRVENQKRTSVRNYNSLRNSPEERSLLPSKQVSFLMLLTYFSNFCVLIQAVRQVPSPTDAMDAAKEQAKQKAKEMSKKIPKPPSGRR
jgi:hypothetical protein